MSTELSTVSAQANLAPTSTQEIAQCWPHNTSQCPENWYQVDNDTCLLVITKQHDELPSDVCSDRGSEPVKRRDIEKLRSCLIRILGELKGASNDDVIRVDRTYYVNIQSGTEETGEGTYNVVCVSRTFRPPTVSLFSLSIDSKTGWSLVVNSTDYVTVNTTHADVALTCEAEGVPKPSVIITSESGARFLSGSWSRLAVCSRAGVYNCTASNSLGTSQVQRRIHILSPIKVNFTANNNTNGRAETRSGDIVELRCSAGDTVELRCSVDGCPDKVTITRNEHLIAQTANHTLPLVHEITGVNCSHMGTYTCLAKSPTGQDVQQIAELEVNGCPVSLCESEDALRELSPILGENATFSLCLISSESLTYSDNETKIVVEFTRNPTTRVSWTVNITMYNIQVKDYRTHTVRIENIHGSLDVNFTLNNEDSDHTPVGQKARGHESLLIALPPVCFIILVFIIVGIVWYRVKDWSLVPVAAIHTNVKESSVGRVPVEQEAEQQQATDRLQCQEDRNTTDLHDQESGRFITADGLVYMTVVSAHKQINKRTQGGKQQTKYKCDYEGRVEYITLDFEKTGKPQIADEEE